MRTIGRGHGGRRTGGLGSSLGGDSDGDGEWGGDAMGEWLVANRASWAVKKEALASMWRGTSRGDSTEAFLFAKRRRDMVGNS